MCNVIQYEYILHHDKQAYIYVTEGRGTVYRVLVKTVLEDVWTESSAM